MNKYIGHPSQLGGIEEVTLAKGKGKGMNLLQIKNTKAIDLTLVCDRCMDMSRLSYKGVNLGWFSPAGYMAPGLYDDAKGKGFLQNFFAGFMTTCGLTAVGGSVEDDGESTPMHGLISNTPCDSYNYWETEDEIIVEAVATEASLFACHTQMKRTYKISKTEDKITLSDTITNIGNKTAPSQVLYHINLGYPLLSENAKVMIPEISSKPTLERFQPKYDMRKTIEKPQAGFSEECYLYDVKEENGMAKIGIYNPDSKVGFTMSFSKETLPFLTEWKMMGEYEYVLGLEPGNAWPCGRKAMRENGELKFLEPGESIVTEIVLEFTDKDFDL
ncbi:MAG: aldose 1-epimerase family protein [Clostridia bacterium]|nr:aldose 1-epimerase family protein [Clostridia bacterium]